MAQTIAADKTFGKTCAVKEKEGRYWLVRKGRNNSRVHPVNADAEGEGELIRTEDLLDVQDYEAPVEETEAEEPAETAAAAE